MWEIIARKPPTLTVGGDEEGLAVLFAVANKGQSSGRLSTVS